MTPRFEYRPDPSPHVFINQVWDPELYRELHFPDHLVHPQRTFGLVSDDPEYADVMADPAWARARSELVNQDVVRWTLDAFRSDIRESGCLVDPDAAHLVDFAESRREKDRRRLHRHGDPNELFCRFDFQSKQQEYNSFVHLDWNRRLATAIVFCSDADEEGLEGGELAFYRDGDYRDDRVCHQPEFVTSFQPRHNTAVLFLNSNDAFHGPRAIRSITGRRRWVSFAISSTVDIWPHRRAPLVTELDQRVRPTAGKMRRALAPALRRGRLA